MHKSIGKMVTHELGEGEKKAPIKSLKIKVKFQKSKVKALERAKK